MIPWTLAFLDLVDMAAGVSIEMELTGACAHHNTRVLIVVKLESHAINHTVITMDIAM